MLEGATRAVVGATTQGPGESFEVLGMEGGDVLVQVLKDYAATHNHVQVGKVVICLRSKISSSKIFRRNAVYIMHHNKVLMVDTLLQSI